MLIESQPDLQFVGAAYDGEAAIALAREARPDVMLMDIRMPLLDGIEATARILNGSNDVDSDGVAHSSEDFAISPNARPKVIMLTTFQRDEAVVRAIHAGADGFIMKDTTPEFVLASIRTVYAGHSVIAPSVRPTLSGRSHPYTGGSQPPNQSRRFPHARGRSSCSRRAASATRTSPRLPTSARRRSRATSAASCRNSRSTHACRLSRTLTGTGFCADSFLPEARRIQCMGRRRAGERYPQAGPGTGCLAALTLIYRRQRPVNLS